MSEDTNPLVERVEGSNSLAHGKPEKYQLLPELPPEQFEALKADIAKRGVIVSVLVDEFGTIIDGHNRARACRELGINDYPVEVRTGPSEVEKRALARQLNVLRRHLTRDQVRTVIAEQLKETPGWSNNRLAGLLGVDDKTVATVREGLTATSEIPKLDRLVGKDGKARPGRKAKPATLKQAADGAYRPSRDDIDDEEDDDDWRPARRRRRHADDDAWNDPVKQAKMQHAVDLIREGVDPNSEKVAKLLREASVTTFTSPGYDPLAGRSEAEKLEWHLFTLFLCFDADAGRDGGEPQGVAEHIEWILQRPYQNVAEWLGPEGDKFRRNAFNGGRSISEQFKADWTVFLAKHREREVPDVIKELGVLQRFGEASASGRFQSNRKRKRSTRAT